MTAALLTSLDKRRKRRSCSWDPLVTQLLAEPSIGGFEAFPNDLETPLPSSSHISFMANNTLRSEVFTVQDKGPFENISASTVRSNDTASSPHLLGIESNPNEDRVAEETKCHMPSEATGRWKYSDSQSTEVRSPLENIYLYLNKLLTFVFLILNYIESVTLTLSLYVSRCGRLVTSLKTFSISLESHCNVFVTALNCLGLSVSSESYEKGAGKEFCDRSSRDVLPSEFRGSIMSSRLAWTGSISVVIFSNLLLANVSSAELCEY